LADAATARAVRREAAAAGIERLEARRVDTARIELRVLAPGASMVELMGDATQWQVRALRAAPGGWWTIQIEAAIATELVLRVDGGAWTVPPGTGVVTDEFGGRVGRLVVP
jgi:1,4-alpha-glucan branching enzyme